MAACEEPGPPGQEDLEPAQTRRRLLSAVQPYGLGHSYASLRIREGASITDLANELGHSPQMTLNTYAHVIDELCGAPRLRAAQETVRARHAVAERGLDRVGGDAVG